MDKNFSCFCPFHSNRDTPAFTVHKTKGLFFCWNPGCQRAGNLQQLVMELLELDPYQALRFILKRGSDTRPDLMDTLRSAMAEEPDFAEYPQATIDALHEQMWGADSRGRDYMRSRGFSDETIKHFEIGYCSTHPTRPSRNNMVLTPMHDPRGMPVGMIGRRADPSDKTFKNTDKLPSSRTLFNLHRARSYDSVFVTEANLDGISVYEATHDDNFVSTLSGYLSPYHIAQMERTFRSIVILTDSDGWRSDDNCPRCRAGSCPGHNPGRVLGYRISQAVRGPKIYWAVYSSEEIYPGGQKDANKVLTEVGPDALRKTLEHPLSTYEYLAIHDHEGLH